MVFHPVDTVAKRLMSNRGHVNMGNLSTVLFKDAATAPVLKKFISLFVSLPLLLFYTL
jgi:hypothetical protein